MEISGFSFDELVDRTHSSSVKWNVGEGELPMWVADMDFKAAPVVLDAMREVIERQSFGYDLVPDSFYNSIIDWQKRRHDVDLEKHEIIFSTGVIPAIRSTIRAFSEKDDGIVMFSPTYNNFFTSVFTNEREFVDCPLDYKDGEYSINWSKLEETLQDEKNKIFLFCNPQNPLGKSYDLFDLEKIAEACIRNNVIMLVDEIHADLTHPGRKHNSVLNIPREKQSNLIAYNAVTKPFNLAGLKTSYVMIRNQEIKTIIEKRFDQDKAQEANSFAYAVTEACYSAEGEAWLDALNAYLDENRKYLVENVTKALPDILFSDADATYLAWLDVSNYTADSKHLADFIRYKTGLFVQAGEIYGPLGHKFIRWNYACPKYLVEDAVNRFVEAVNEYKESELGFQA